MRHQIRATPARTTPFSTSSNLRATLAPTPTFRATILKVGLGSWVEVTAAIVGHFAEKTAARRTAAKARSTSL